MSYGTDITLSAISLSTVGAGEVFYLFDGNQGEFKRTDPGSRPLYHDIKIGENMVRFPLSYMWKDALQAGEYFTKHATGQVLSLNRQELEEAAQTVKQFLANGNSIPIPFKDHKEERNIGFCVDARVQDGRLELLHQLIGVDHTLEALRNKISVKMRSQHVDPKGNTYKNCIVHSSLTDDPVVTGQNPWSAIAASRGEQSTDPIYVFAASRKQTMNIAELRKLLGLADNVPDDEVLKKAHERLSGVPAIEAKVTELTTKLTAADTKVTDLTNQLATKSTEVVTLSAKLQKTKPSASELYFAMTAVKAKREALVKAGAITAATADKIEKRFLGATDLNTISLSRESTEADISLSAGMATVLDTYEALEGNTVAPKEGEESNSQTVDDKKNDTGATGAVNDKDKDKNKDNKGPKNSRDVVNTMMGNRYKGLQPAGAK